MSRHALARWRRVRPPQTVEQHYTFHNLIGKGQFGFVYRATDRRKNIEYAVRAAAAQQLLLLLPRGVAGELLTPFRRRAAPRADKED